MTHNRSERRSLLGRLFLAAATAVFAFVSLAAWALASPVGASPDEDFHLVSIWCALGERPGLCAAGEAPHERIVPERLVESSQCFKFAPLRSAACPLNDQRMVTTQRGNFLGNYPPVFYSVMSVFATPDIARSVIVMRLVNAALFVGLVTSALALLRSGQRGPIIWGGLVTLIPLGVFLIPSVNPSGWAILAGLTVWVSCYGYFTAATRARRVGLGLLTTVLVVMGSAARAEAAVFLIFALCAALAFSFVRDRVWRTRAILPATLSVLASFFFFFSRQAIDIATVGVHMPGQEQTATAVSASAGSQLALLLNNLLHLPELWSGGTGTWGLGWVDTPMPITVYVLMLVLLSVLIVRGLTQRSTRKTLLLLLGCAALTIIPLYILQSKGKYVGDWVQPRYLLPLIIIVVGIALFGFTHDHLFLSNIQIGLIFTGVGIANALALHRNLRRYLTGIGSPSMNLNEQIEWWWNIPFSPMTIWLLGSAAFALMLVGLGLALGADRLQQQGGLVAGANGESQMPGNPRITNQNALRQ